MTPFAQATPSQIAAHQAHQARLGRIWKPQARPVAPRKVVAPKVEPKRKIVPPAFIDMLSGCSWRTIVRFVAAQHGIEPKEILGKSRFAVAVKARQHAMYMVRTHCSTLSLPTMGRIFRRDHTTVLYSIRAYKGELRPRRMIISGEDRKTSVEGSKLVVASPESGLHIKDRHSNSEAVA